MKSYLFVEKSQDFSDINENYLKNKCPVLSGSLDDVRNNPAFDPKNHSIVLIDFVDEDNVRQAIMSSYMGNTCNKIKIKILEIINIDRLE